MFTSRPPVADLAAFVDAIWYVDEPALAGLERAVPNGTMQIVINLAADTIHWYDEGARHPSISNGAGLCGPLARPVRIDAAEQRHCLGVSFRAGGAVPFFHPPADTLAEPVIGLDVLWGRDGSTLRERLLEQPSPAAMMSTLERLLLRRVIRPDLMRAAPGSPPDPALDFGVQALRRGTPVQAVADQLGFLPSTFSRRFRATVGLNPKPFARVMRLQRVLGEVSASAPAGRIGEPAGRIGEPAGRIGEPGYGRDAAIDWADVAARHGYFDQAHLINEFRSLVGITPGAYEPRSVTEPNHVPISD